jgi:aminoglycoside phosphotransferase (APT) family kinase protein
VGDNLKSRLQRYLRERLPGAVSARVEDLASIADGWESDVYAFVLRSAGGGRERLVLRIYQGPWARDESAHEFAGLRRLHAADYPVPRVWILERESAPLGRPFVVMEYIEGRSMASLLYGSEGEERARLLDLFCELFVRLHALPRGPFADCSADGQTCDPSALLQRELARTRRLVTRSSKPGFLPVLDWLETRKHQVPRARPSVVHGDFHPDNILVRDTGSACVIDWTQIDVSDARLDLAWTLVLVSTHRGEQWRRAMLDGYQNRLGSKIENIEYFETAACAKRLLFVVVAMQDPTALGMRPEVGLQIRRHIGAFARAYDQLQQHTGRRVAEVEEMLASHS